MGFGDLARYGVWHLLGGLVSIRMHIARMFVRIYPPLRNTKPRAPDDFNSPRHESAG